MKQAAVQTRSGADDGLNYSDALHKVNELEDYEDLYWTKLLTENKKHNT